MRSTSVGYLGILLSVPALAQSVLPIGDEFQVHSYTTDEQYRPSVAVDADGDFVVVWQSFYQDGSYRGVFGRRFDRTGMAQGLEFQVNLTTVDSQMLPSVAIEASGDFVVAWQSFLQDGSGTAIVARRFDSAGGAVGGEFIVNTQFPGDQVYATVDLDADGDFVIAWESESQDGSGLGVFARRFNSAGAAGPEFPVNNYTVGDQRRPDVAMDGDGDFVVVWHSPHDGDAEGVFGRRFNGLGGAVGTEFLVNTFTLAVQAQPKVDMNAAGAFVVAFSSSALELYTTVFARRYDSSGAPLDTETMLHAQFGSGRSAPAVKVDAAGGFVAAWQGPNPGMGGPHVFARAFDTSGSPRGVETMVNTFTPLAQLNASIGIDDSGHFVVAWDGYNQDGDQSGVFARRLAVAATLDVDGDGVITALTDGLLVLRYEFGFRGAILVNGAVGVACKRCTAPAIEAHLRGISL